METSRLILFGWKNTGIKAKTSRSESKNFKYASFLRKDRSEMGVNKPILKDI